MSDDDDDWETADLSTFGKTPVPSSSKNKIIPSSADIVPHQIQDQNQNQTQNPNLRPSAPTFQPRVLAGPTASGSGGGRTILLSKTAMAASAGAAERNVQRSTSTDADKEKQDKTQSSPFDDDEAWSRPMPSTTNRQIWNAANSHAPAALPPSNPSAAPTPSSSLRILRRPSPPSSGTGANGQGGAGGSTVQRKTLEEREEEYRKARERIFAREKEEEEERKRNVGAGGRVGEKLSPSVSGTVTPNLPAPGKSKTPSSSQPPTPNSVTGQSRTNPTPNARSLRENRGQEEDEIDEIIRAAEALALPPSSSSSTSGASTPFSNPHSRPAIPTSSSSSSASSLAKPRLHLPQQQQQPKRRSPAHSPNPVPRRQEDEDGEDDFETRTDMLINRIQAQANAQAQAQAAAMAMATGGGQAVLLPHAVQMGMGGVAPGMIPHGMGIGMGMGMGGMYTYQEHTAYYGVGMVQSPGGAGGGYGIMQTPPQGALGTRGGQGPGGQGYLSYGYEALRPPGERDVGIGRGAGAGELRRGGSGEAGVLRQPRGPEEGGRGFASRGGGGVGR